MAENINPPIDEIIDTLDKMEIVSINYPTLMAAMGDAKWKAFTYGEGLSRVPQLQEQLSKHGFERATYSIGTFINITGSEETSLFVEQSLAESRVIFELETDLKKYLTFDMYKAKHLYIVGKDGVTVDLVEELIPGFELYVCPNDFYSRIRGSGMQPQDKRIIITDLNKMAMYRSGEGIEARLSAGLPVILHEFGHMKHMHIDPEAHFLDNRARITSLCATFGITRDVLDRAVKEQNIALLKPLLKVFEEYGSFVLKNEKIASLWASRWLERKSAQGADFWKPAHEEFWEQLDVGLASHKLLLALSSED